MVPEYQSQHLDLITIQYSHSLQNSVNSHPIHPKSPPFRFPFLTTRSICRHKTTHNSTKLTSTYISLDDTSILPHTFSLPDSLLRSLLSLLSWSYLASSTCTFKLTFTFFPQFSFTHCYHIKLLLHRHSSNHLPFTLKRNTYIHVQRSNLQSFWGHYCPSPSAQSFGRRLYRGGASLGLRSVPSVTFVYRRQYDGNILVAPTTGHKIYNISVFLLLLNE